MKAIALIPGTTTVRLVERPEPEIQSPDQVKLRILRVGICGTDREEAAGGRSMAPEGLQDLVLGHEMFGQVVATGQKVSRVRSGDYAVLTVRRGCGICLPCDMNRSDMCRTGLYHERGIWGMDGYQTEFVVDTEQYVVRVPPEIAPLGVLSEPTSVAEKAIDEAVRLQFARMPDAQASLDWLYGRACLVAGLGPIGLLAAMILRLRGARVYGLDIVESGSSRPQWLEKIGGQYVDGNKVPPDQVQKMLEPMELIFEATGVPGLAFNLLDGLALNGIYVLTGIPGGDRPLQLDGAQLIRELVLDNQVMVGSVNAARDHFQMAVDDLSMARLRWGDIVQGLITHRYPYSQFADAFAPLSGHGVDDIKSVIEWAQV